jgi:hypothetical protein
MCDLIYPEDRGKFLKFPCNKKQQNIKTVTQVNNHLEKLSKRKSPE